MILYIVLNFFLIMFFSESYLLDDTFNEQTTLTPYREAVLEQPKFNDKLHIIYDRILSKYGQQIQAKPVIDKINNLEKYDNDGGAYLFLTKKLVLIAQNISSVFNGIIDFPFNMFQKVTKKVKESVDDWSSKTFGL